MKEASLGKITRKFFFKVLIWFLVINIIVGIAVIAASADKLDSTRDLDTVIAVNGLIKSLVIVNIVACVLAPLLATRKIKKKFIINEENKKKVFRNAAIVLCILAALLIGTHAAIKAAIFKEALKSEKVTEKEVKEGLKDLEEFADEYGFNDEEAEELSRFMKLADVYVWDGLAFIVMIGCEYFLIVMREQKPKEE